MLTHRFSSATVARRSLAGLLLLAITICNVTAHAGFTSLNIGKNGGNSPDFTGTGPRRQFLSSVGLKGPFTSKNFCVRYSSVLGVDVSGVGNTESESATSSYFADFGITHSGNWTVKLTATRRGFLTIKNDAGGYADAQLHGITASVSPGGTLAPLQFGAQSTTNQNSSSSNRNDPVNQTGTTLITGTGNASRLLNFTWGSNVISHGQFLTGGDEAAVRLGTSSTLSNFTAGKYANNDSAQPGDGHIICAEFCDPPSVVVTYAFFCAPLAGQPCTFTAYGHVKGCLGQNYTVVLTYLNNSNGFVTNAFVPVSNGNPNWSSQVTVPGPCNGAPYNLIASVVDNPGLVASAHNNPRSAENAQGNPVTRTVVPRATVNTPCGPRQWHPSKASKFLGNFVQAFVSCGNAGGNSPNSATEADIPSCKPPETFNDQAGGPPNGWHWDKLTGQGQVQFKASKVPLVFPPNDTLNPPGDTTDLIVKVKVKGIVYSGNIPAGPSTGFLATVARATFDDRAGGEMTVVDFPANFPLPISNGRINVKTSADTLLNGISQPGLPHLSNIETVSVTITDENGNTFANVGLFLP